MIPHALIDHSTYLCPPLPPHCLRSVLACVEDCPAPAFVSWSFRSVTLAPEAFAVDAQDPVSCSFDVYFKLVQLGQHLMDADLTQVHACALYLCGARQYFHVRFIVVTPCVFVCYLGSALPLSAHHTRLVVCLFVLLLHSFTLQQQ